MCYVKSQQTHDKTTFKRGGIVKITWPIFNFGAPNDISGTAKPRVVKFYTPVGCVILCLIYFFGNMTIKYKVVVKCVHDILSPKGMCSESRDLFTFLEMSDNVS